MLLHIIADYGHGDLAFAEVVQQFKLHLSAADPVLTPVPPFATLAAGFCIAQLALNSGPADAIIFHNIAPRADDDSAREGNAGEELVYARLTNGVQIVGVHAGETFSFLRDEAAEIRRVKVPTEGSQFRSRDFFPQVTAAIVSGKENSLGEKIPPNEIPDVPEDRVAYIDGYGNLKTTIAGDQPKFTNGEKVTLTINGKTCEAIASDGTFAVEPGVISFAPGSSGWPRRKGGPVRWREIFLRGGSAAEKFGNPQSGAKIEIA